MSPMLTFMTLIVPACQGSSLVNVVHTSNTRITIGCRKNTVSVSQSLLEWDYPMVTRCLSDLLTVCHEESGVTLRRVVLLSSKRA